MTRAGYVPGPVWRLFQFGEIFEAEAFAAAGGIAIHLSGDWIPPGRSEPCPCAHLFGPDRATLTAAAFLVGCKPSWIQYPDNPKRMHFDVWGALLAKAKKLCLQSNAQLDAPAAPPTLFDSV